ncbi:hypothetical protein J4405_04460 [Candidatus Woesearchaeota archaeon]|nr:hypothetical protein [Candidatus Woesearchaeota archaeon]
MENENEGIEKFNSDNKNTVNNISKHTMSSSDDEWMSHKYWMFASVGLAFILVISLFTSGLGLSNVTGNAVKSDDIKVSVSNLLAEMPSITSAVVTDVKEQNGLYLVTATINSQPAEIYVSKDGTLLFPSAIPIAETLTSLATQDTTNQDTTPEVLPKADKPKVDLYVMSFCPYGNQAEDTMLPVYNMLKDKVEWNMHYIVNVDGTTVNSLHGQLEVDQNEREACVLNDYGLDTWWKFATYVNKNCGRDGSCWKVGATTLGLDSAKIESCVASKGLEYMKANEQASVEAGAQGSPTMLINGVETTVVYQYGDSEAYKQVICSAFNNAPSECTQVLTTATSASAGGSC